MKRKNRNEIKESSDNVTQCAHVWKSLKQRVIYDERKGKDEYHFAF